MARTHTRLLSAAAFAAAAGCQTMVPPAGTPAPAPAAARDTARG
ncbi:MAG: hypothetical protein AVDCRST_MAG11-826, partial [uncultured Gemmatimonadaceae bacterium]